MVVDALKTQVTTVAYRMTGNRADADDLAQEIFVTLYRNFSKYDDSLPFAPWFRRLMTNAAINYRKKHFSHRPQPLVEQGAEDPEPRDVEPIEKALASLPEEYRTAVTLKYYQGLEVDEIAEAMKVPVGTVKTWLFRAREALREKLRSLA